VATKREWYIAGENNYVPIFGATWDAQTFTVGTVGVNENFTISSVKILAEREGTPGTLLVGIKAVDGEGLPTGEDLSTGSVNPTGWATDPEWHEISMTAYELVASTQYALIVKSPASSDTSNCVRWWLDETGEYAGGNQYHTSTSGESWDTYAYYDLLFEIWGETPPITLAGEIVIGCVITGALSLTKTLTGEIIISSTTAGSLDVSTPSSGLSADIILEKNKIATGSAWLILLEITLTDSTIFRLVRNNEDVTFEGDVYTAFNFQLEASSHGSRGEIPTVALSVSNITQLIEPKLQELDGGVGSTVKITIINSNLLLEDYSELEMLFEVLACMSTAQWIIFTLGAPSPLRQRFPLDKYLALHCCWRFETVECSYDRKDVDDVTLAGGNPVSIQAGGSGGHGFVTDDIIRAADIAGVTPSLAGAYVITRTDDNNFTLNDTVSSDYAGNYTSGGTVGYSSCKRTLSDCRDRENTVRFGGFPGMRSGGIRIV